MGYINKVIPSPSWDERIEAAQAATEHAASLGVTSVQDMSAGTDIGVYQELHRRGTLKTRVYGCSPLSDYRGGSGRVCDSPLATRCCGSGA
jgi:predicted amidohydrolase YtcJ